MSSMLISVITTIQRPTSAVVQLMEKLNYFKCKLVVIGDKKGPDNYALPGSDFFSFEDQMKLKYKLAHLLPTNHYARKNIGYLIAIHGGAKSIYETDDDNTPSIEWKIRDLNIRSQKTEVCNWMNVYRFFSDELIWPRGFPLDMVARIEPYITEGDYEGDAPIQQGLANISPDVDAVWRLIMDHEVQFTQRESIWLPPNTLCPFNSQSTWWWPVVFPLLYLPSYCSFRMTDIWRSFVAQRCLWELGYGVVFHAPEVFQKRNYHNLMKDFEDEMEGYVNNKKIGTVLSKLSLKSGKDNIRENMCRCYESLISEGFFPKYELTLVKAWLEDLGIDEYLPLN